MKYAGRLIAFVLLFLVPLAAVAAYEIGYASDRYHSDASLIITEEQSSVPQFDLSVIGLPTATQDKDALVLEEFILSIDMLQYLDDKLKLREHYSMAGIDWLARLDAGATREEFHEYFAGYLTVDYDTEAKILHIHVQAFDRGFARAIQTAVIARSQDFIDKLNARVTTEQTEFFEKQLRISEQRLIEVKDELLKFQREHRLLTTESEASLIMANIAELERILTAKQAEFSTKEKELFSGSPIIEGLKADIASMRTQIAREKERLSGAGSAALSELDIEFRSIQLNMEFVTNIYKSNLTQLETVRLEAIRRLKFLVVVTPPTLADGSEFPDRPFIVGSASLVLLMAYFVISLMIAIIREHS